MTTTPPTAPRRLNQWPGYATRALDAMAEVLTVKLALDLHNTDPGELAHLLRSTATDLQTLAADLDTETTSSDTQEVRR